MLYISYAHAHAHCSFTIIRTAYCQPSSRWDALPHPWLDGAVPKLQSGMHGKSIHPDSCLHSCPTIYTMHHKHRTPRHDISGDTPVTHLRITPDIPILLPLVNRRPAICPVPNRVRQLSGQVISLTSCRPMLTSAHHACTPLPPHQCQ